MTPTFKPIELMAPSWYILQDDSGDYLLMNADTAIEYFPTLEKAQCYIQRNGKHGDTVNVTYKVSLVS